MTKINNDKGDGVFYSFFANKFDDGSTKLTGQPNFKHQIRNNKRTKPKPKRK